MTAPHPTADTDDSAAADMDIAADTPPSHSRSPMDPPHSRSPSVGTPRSPGSPALRPTGMDTTDRLATDADSGDVLGVPGELSSFDNDLGLNPPPALSQSTHSPPEGLVPSRSNTPTPGTTFTQPLLASAGSGTFDLTDVRGDFISEEICAYWELVPGGEEWIEMVKSYLMLETIAPGKGVSIISLYSFKTN